MNNLISKQQAINIIQSYKINTERLKEISVEDVVDMFEDLIDDIENEPSVQPEKETCKDCKWEDSLGYGECHHCKRQFEDMWEEKDNG